MDPADQYTRLLLPQKHGYPLWNPRPHADASDTAHFEDGVQLGDVGFVQYDGSFVWLFNICNHNKDVILRPQKSHDIFQPPDNSSITAEQSLSSKYRGSIGIAQCVIINLPFIYT